MLLRWFIIAILAHRILHIVVNPVSSVAGHCGQILSTNTSMQSTPRHLQMHLDWICICPWGCLHTLLIFSLSLTAFIVCTTSSLFAGRSFRPTVSPPPRLNGNNCVLHGKALFAPCLRREISPVSVLSSVCFVAFQRVIHVNTFYSHL